jgi:thioredoxin-dependent peroxiredoxin
MNLFLRTGVLFALFITSSFAGGNGMLKIGTTAPEYSLPSDKGASVNSKDFIGRKYVVLIFYPGDETPVCTQQLCEIRDSYSAFAAKDAVVFGINPAGKNSHTKFSGHNNFQFPLLMDEGNKTAKKYEANGFIMNKRTVYVIDKSGKIIYAQRGKPPVQEILASIPGVLN